MFKSQIGGLALNRRKWPEIGPEWSPGPENRPPGMPRPFSRLWDQSRGPKPAKKVKKWRVWGLALGLFEHCVVVQSQTRAQNTLPEVAHVQFLGCRSAGLVRTRYFIPGSEPEGEGGQALA